MTDNTVAAEFSEKLFGALNTGGGDAKLRLMRIAVRLLAAGEPVTVAQLAHAAGVVDVDLEHAAAGKDIEYDDQGRIVGWGLTCKPTPHKFTIDDRQFFTWCAPDTLVFPAVIGRTAHVESPCPTTGATITVTVDPDSGVTALDPPTAVVSIVDPAQMDPDAVRATVCNPQHFFANAYAARDWQSRYPGMRVLPVAEAYRHIMRPLAEGLLGDEASQRGC